MTDTADLVNELREGRLVRRKGLRVDLVPDLAADEIERPKAALSSTQARADKLEAELASAQQSNENWMNRCLAAESSLAAARDAALEEAAKVADDYKRDGSLTKAYECETADELAARIRALKTAAGKNQ